MRNAPHPSPFSVAGFGNRSASHRPDGISNFKIPAHTPGLRVGGWELRIQNSEFIIYSGILDDGEGAVVEDS